MGGLFSNFFRVYRQNQDKVEHAKNVRNYHLGVFERINIGMNLLLCFLGFIMILSGISFISNDLIGQTHFTMKALKS